MFYKIAKYSAPNCPFTKLRCFLIIVLKPCLILDNSFIFVAWNLSQTALISVVSLNTFLNNLGRLEPFSAVAWILIEIKLLSLDPFRKMFKCQKTPFRGTTNLQKFYSRCMCYRKSSNKRRVSIKRRGYLSQNVLIIDISIQLFTQLSST